MVWTTISADDMHAVARQLFQPCILLVTYTLLQYLVVFYWARRREPRVLLLFGVSALGVICIIPFANPDEHITGGLNDVSESCVVITFLLQITIIGRDLNKKIKFKTVLYLTWMAELLVLADLLMVVFSLVIVVWPDALGDDQAHLQDDLPNVFENLNLAYIFFFRFFYIIQSRGWREIFTKRKVEVTWYLLFATHEVPFIVLEHASGLSWESFQAIWHRVTLAGCLYVTATGKLRGRPSANSRVESTSSPQKHGAQQSRSSAGRFKRMSTTRRSSTNVYAVATTVYAVAAARTASMDRPTSVPVVKKELVE